MKELKPHNRSPNGPRQWQKQIKGRHGEWGWGGREEAAILNRQQLQKKKLKKTEQRLLLAIN